MNIKNKKKIRWSKFIDVSFGILLLIFWTFGTFFKFIVLSKVIWFNLSFSFLIGWVIGRFIAMSLFDFFGHVNKMMDQAFENLDQSARVLREIENYRDTLFLNKKVTNKKIIN